MGLAKTDQMFRKILNIFDPSVDQKIVKKVSGTIKFEAWIQ